MSCPRCQKRGKPDHFASEPECAFKREVFDSSNWQCATMNALRELARGEDIDSTVYCNDQWAGLVPIGDTGDFIVLGWYKDRGRTEQAYVMHAANDARRDAGRLLTPLTLEQAEEALKGGG